MYHHKREKSYRRGEFTRETLLDLIPEGDFIAVFGTSHTKGCCKMEQGKFTHMDTEYTWPDIVCKSLQIPYVNFAIPGNTNQVIIQQLIDFFEIPEVKDRCKLILAEVRLGDISGTYFFDLFTDRHADLPITRTDFISGGYSRHWLDEVSGSFVPKNDPKHVTELVRNTDHVKYKDIVPPAAVKQMERIVDVYCETALISSQKMVEDILYTRTMAHICKSHNIPFKYFIWDHNKISHSESYYADIKEVTDELYNLEQYTFKSILPNVNVSCVKEMDQETWDSTLCECGHRNHVIHEWVADKIIKELKDGFCS